ncbi:MAG: caspase, EACC1-associated type [Pseudonocardiaceae bacterium]
MRLPDPARSRAVLIGSSRFSHSCLPGLPAVRNNLCDLAAILTAPTGTGLSPECCVVLADETDLATVGAYLEDSAEHAEDVLLFYYSGHGVLNDRGELYLSLPSTNPERLRWTGLPLAQIREVLADAPAKNRVLILDCCFSGRAIEEFMSDPISAVSGQLDIDGTYTLTATPRNAPAMAPAGAVHTAFTGELIALLNKGIPDGPELLTLGAIYGQLRWKFNSRGLPSPQQRGTRTADLLALAPNRARLATEAGATMIREQTPAELAQRLAELAVDTARVLGPDHPETLNIRDKHASQVGLAGDPREAARCYVALATDRARVLGPDHPDTLKTRESHARWIGQDGDLVEAARLHAALLADRTRIGNSVRKTPRSAGRSKAVP